MTPFAPSAWAQGGHRQTLLGYLARRTLAWTRPVEDWVVTSEGDVRLLCAASWQAGERRERPAIVLVHGLGGHANAGYMLATGRLLWEHGWHVIRMNLRGAGRSETLCPRLYNAGLTADVTAVLRETALHAPRVALLGFSLGGNLALLQASRDAGRLAEPLLGVAAVSAPTALAECADCLDGPGNGLYRRHYLDNLRATYSRRQRLRPDLFEPNLERGLTSIRTYDDVITARYGGYRDAAEYYERSSSGPWLARLTAPTLILLAADDPIVPVASVARWPLAAQAQREITATGGHVGFVAKTTAPGRFWAAERLTVFFEDLLTR